MTTSLPVLEPTPAAAVTPPASAELAQLRQRAHFGIWIETLGTLALLLVAYALPSFLTDRALRLEWIYRALLLVSFAVVVVRLIDRRLLQPMRVPLGDEEMALAVERSAPDVKQALISSLQFARELQGGARSIESPALKAAVVADVRQRLASIPFAAAIDARRVQRFGAGLALAVLFFGSWAAIDAGTLGLWARRNLTLSNVDWPRWTRLSLIDTQDGVVRLPQGDALTVRIAVDGPVPDQAFVDYTFANGDRGTEPMSRTGEREFTWTIESVLADVQLSAQAGDSLPLLLTVTVVERPRVDGLAVTVTFPAYMGREPMLVPNTEGELRLPKGASLALRGTSQKPLTEAFALFANDQKSPLVLGADQRSFAGEFAPTASGLLVIDVVDHDRLGAGTPPKLLLRVGDDKTPTIEFRLRGIGTSITDQAVIPGDLKAKDDFGLRDVGSGWRVIDDKPLDKGATPPPEPPFVRAETLLRDPFEANLLRYETVASVDLRQWNKSRTEGAPENPIRPGMLFSLRFWARDNFGPGEPHEGFGEAMAFRIVTSAQLTEELRRRQIEQRTELQTLLEEQQRATMEIQEMANPAQAGERRKLVEARFKALTRQQQALGRRVAFVGESYQRILWEYENNRLIESNQVRQIEAVIPQPLQAVAKEAFPTAARQIDAFATGTEESARATAIATCRDIEKRILAVLAEMKQAESLAALIEELKGVIRLENDAMQDAKRRAQGREQDIFQPKKPEPPKQPEKPK